MEWWRGLPPELLRDAHRSILFSTLKQIRILRADDDLAAALRGDAAAAISAAVCLMPIGKITLQIDISMSALMHAALNRNAAAALVMAQIVGLTNIGHELGAELAEFTYGLRHSRDPHKFSEAENVLSAAFRERHNKIT